MAVFFDKLPTILVLAVMVGIFVALRRHVKSARLHLWIAAWVLIFGHFFVQLFEPADGNLTPVTFMIDLGCLQLSALFFVASLTSFFENTKLTVSLLVLIGVPVTAYTAGLAYELDWRWLYISCSVIIFYGSPLFVVLRRKLILEFYFWAPTLIATGTVAIVRAWRHQFNFGFLAMLTLGFALPGLLFLRRYPRWSPGVVTSAGGFLLWGSVFPIGAMLDAWAPNLKVNPELWNTPKFFVAFGMILTLLEDKSEFLRSAGQREQKLNYQLQKFSNITSRLLSGVDVNAVCHEIALAIRETSSFDRVAIILSPDGSNLYVAGHCGYEGEAAKLVEYKCSEVWKFGDLVEACAVGDKLGERSVLLRPEQMEKYGQIPSSTQYQPSRHWTKGNQVVVPLQSMRGAQVGCIALTDPRDVTRVNAEEMTRIEMLARDLAVTIDNAALHRQLALAEKLAAIGQLVAGVAHELNNPLTSIVGYSELISDDIPPGPVRQKLDKMLREAQRMKRIIENLLRFARQNNLEKKSANLEVLLQDVLALREYHLRNHDIEVLVQIEPGLPHVALDEDQFKQILLNLLNNSIDALEGNTARKIRIEATYSNSRVTLRFDDNGPGFGDVNRVFDPFYTTKPVGKGTGLGLSICYGIVKEHGGDIHAENLEPNGARVALELPVETPMFVGDAAMAEK
ncbi:MAG TPA: GAF domain-containing sensor histidine kinase [Candidatus Angelobacter sp.]|nr:GAF domain-containing sensor histidine kinase [Candidatus Angelobacter sp.]